MGEPTVHPPALLVLAAFSRREAAFTWAKNRAESEWGPVALESPRFDFSETNYYESTMGPGLKKVFWAFALPFDPAALAQTKLLTNAWEEQVANAAHEHEIVADDGSPIVEPRPLNLDPGYLTVAKLVLASTKDHAHRIYLRDGIFAEITLFYRHGRWEHHEWTFPDYRRGDYQEFFTACRNYLKQRR